jgi:hypothetical protein
LKAEFFGDAYYRPSSDVSKTAIVFAFPDRGAFVLGDSTVATATPTTNVTWWDASGESERLTGGSAPASFKGFAEAVTTSIEAGKCLRVDFRVSEMVRHLQTHKVPSPIR